MSWYVSGIAEEIMIINDNTTKNNDDDKNSVNCGLMLMQLGVTEFLHYIHDSHPVVIYGVCMVSL